MGDTSQMAFNVNVIVEEIEDEINTEESNETTKIELPLDNVTNKQDKKSFYTQVISTDDCDDESITSENSNSAMEPKCNQEDNSNEIEVSSSNFDNTMSNVSDSGYEKFYIIRKRKIYTLTRETILKGIEEQACLLKNKSDILINKFIRSHHPEYYIHPRTVHESLLDNVIELWKNWYENNPRFSKTPFLYKCYICNNGWCRLDPFRQHIIIHKHPNLILALEEAGQEVNIVASIGNSIRKRIVTINANCWKCNKPVKSNLLKVFTRNNSCDSCVQSNMGLHGSACKPSLNEHSGVLCTICSMYCKNKDLYSHMVLYHTPKSDEPAVTYTKICKLCEEQYFIKSYHDCPKRSKLYKCYVCCNKYISKPLLQLHMSMNKNSSSCPDCSKKFKQCYLVEHLLNHSGNYDMLQYCCKCKNNLLYSNCVLFNKHMSNHGDVTRRRRYKVKMLLPLNCIKCVTVESLVPLEVPYKDMHKYLCDFEYMNYTPLKLMDIIKKRNATKTDDVQLSGTINIEQNREKQKLLETEFERTVNPEVIESDFEYDNYAFQDQLDAEIQRDVEIEKEISKVFKASSIYKKFLDKEANEPIDDYDVCIINKKQEVFVISDSDSETSQIIIDTVCEDISNIKQEITESDVDIENTSNHSNDIVIEENFNNVKIEYDVEDKNSLVLNQDTDNVEQIKEDNDVKDSNIVNTIEENYLITENVECEIKKETSDIVKEEIEEENIDVMNYNNLDFTAIKSESITYEVDLNTGCLNDWSVETPGCSKKRKQEKTTHNYELWINKDKTFNCTQCSYTGCYKEYIDHTMNCFNIKCTYCTKAFNDVKLYLRHLSYHKLRYLSCPQCFKKFYLINNLKNHIMVHIHELYLIVPSDVGRKQEFNTFICNMCDGIIQIENFFIHWESHLDLNEAIEDEMSDKEAELKSMMTPEMVNRVLAILTNAALNKKHKVCVVCSKNFVRRVDCKRHLIEHLLHEAKIEMAATGAKLRCPICDQHIEDLPGWRQHLREHSHIKTYRCSLCPKKFCDSSNYSKHRKVHNQHKYICDLCGGKFCAKPSIIRHLKTHEPMNPLPCPQCHRIFDSDNKLRKHIRVKHNKYPLSCPVCRRKFKTCKQRWDHMWDKHKLRKCIADCPICKKQYRRVIDVKNHLKSAHGLK